MTEDDKSIFDDESTDFYDEFKDRMRQEPLSSVLNQKAPASKPLGGIVTVLAGVFIAALVLWYIIGKYFVVDETENEMAPPVISADNEPVKERPENVGGMEIVGKDKSVYDRISQSKRDEPEKIIAREMVDAPVAPAVPAPVVETERITVEVKETVRPVIQDKQKEDIVVSPTMPKAIEQVNEAPKKIAEVVTETKIVETKVEVKPVYEPLKTDIKAAAPVAAKALSKDAWKVQIMSSRDKAAIAKSWERLQKKHSDILGGVSYEIVEANLGDRGVFYRLRVGEFSDRKAADALCGELKKRKQDCIVVK